ncbi:MAG: Thoeris anti-defense Tad2 family protein [Microbacterium sp.]
MSEKSEERESESVELLPPEYAQAAQEIVEVLIKHEIDPEQYDRLFRVARMLLDVKFDGSTPLEPWIPSQTDLLAEDWEVVS